MIPQTLICTFILAGILFMPRDGFTTPLWARMAFELFILTAIALPTLSVHLSDEIRRAEQEPFIEASKTIGGRKFHIFFHHLVPLLRERWIMVFGRQFMQVLLLLAHLGVFKLFFGGTLLQENTSFKPPLSVTKEWSGLIGGSLSNLYVSQWIALVPLAFFVLTAIAAALINDAVKEYFSASHESRKTTKALPDAKTAELKKAL
ncbi:hypothetical protein LRR81_16865 [Metabacillus sp. GX 13764]|uniref:hypothetical protein n=1 Tax=Metabacillus kandeliae TaxID=2900151 RepID=UPI001E61A267|nr:hypothetical protein [Metabacillus kandeliae]MCD7035918.1 hypothetical protein [Metabacillus kandeliae]